MYIKVIDYVGQAPYPDQGIWFRNNVFYPYLIRAIEEKDKVILDFDGAYGYPTTFIKNIFSEITEKLLNKYVIIVNQEYDYMENEVKSFCKKKEKVKKRGN